MTRKEKCYAGFPEQTKALRAGFRFELTNLRLRMQAFDGERRTVSSSRSTTIDLARSELPVKSLSKPAAYLGGRKPSLPDGHGHQAKVGDYVYSPDHYVLGAFAKTPEIRLKRTRHVPKESTD